MPKPDRTRVELRELVSAKIKADPELAEDGEIRVPFPSLRAPVDGCNWDMAFFGNARGRGAAFRGIVEYMRARYNMRTPERTGPGVLELIARRRARRAQAPPG